MNLRCLFYGHERIYIPSGEPEFWRPWRCGRQGCKAKFLCDNAPPIPPMPFAIHKLQLRAGDKLIIRTKYPLTEARRAKFYEILGKHFPTNSFLVLEPDVELSVIHQLPPTAAKGNAHFLQWIHARLEFVHKENPSVDYMHRLHEIIKELKGEE